MKYLGLVVCLVSLVLFMFVALVLAYSSESIGFAVMIGAMILFVCGQFLYLVEDEIAIIKDECPYEEPLHNHHDGCPSCYMGSIADTESTHR